MTTTTVLRTLTFPPPGPLLSMNARQHWREHHRCRQVWAEAVYWHAMAQPRQPTINVPVTIDVALPVKTNRRRDPANMFATVKVVCDALCEPRGSRKLGAGWLIDDDTDHVTIMEPVVVVGGQLVTVTLRART